MNVQSVASAMRRKVEDGIAAGFIYLGDAALWWKNRIMGRTYIDFYAARMDRLALANPKRVTGRPKEKLFQFEYLRDHGLEPHMALLDYGCGTCAAGVHFIHYLNAGGYTGADISENCLAIGRERIRQRNLLTKNPTLLLLKGDTLEALADKKFDVIWAQSVLTHLPPANIGFLLKNIRRHMHPKSIFYANYALAKNGPEQHVFKDWAYGPDFFLALAERLNLDCRQMDDWNHPKSKEDKLLRFQLLGTCSETIENNSSKV